MRVFNFHCRDRYDHSFIIFADKPGYDDNTRYLRASAPIQSQQHPPFTILLCWQDFLLTVLTLPVYCLQCAVEQFLSDEDPLHQANLRLNDEPMTTIHYSIGDSRRLTGRTIFTIVSRTIVRRCNQPNKLLSPVDSRLSGEVSLIDTVDVS